MTVSYLRGPLSRLTSLSSLFGLPRLSRLARRSPGRLALALSGTLAALGLLVAAGCGPAAQTPAALPSLAAASASASSRPTSDHLTVIVVRAAERTTSKGAAADDPPLNADGLKRAQHLAGLLAGEPGTAVYVTPYQRTQSTAMPTANRWKVAPSLYDPTDPVTELVARVHADSPHGTVLIVGHRDNTPRIVSAFCGCGVDPLPEGNYARMYRLTFAADGSLASTERVENY